MSEHRPVTRGDLLGYLGLLAATIVFFALVVAFDLPLPH